MGDAIRAHVAVHLACLRRQRLVLATLAVLTLGTVTSLTASLTLIDVSNRFDVLRGMAVGLHGLAKLMTAAVGMLLVRQHRRSWSLAVVATTPAPFAAWVASVLITGAVVGAAAQAVIGVTCAALSMAWGVTYQYGFVYLAIDHFAESLILLGVATVLASVLHPVIVGTAAFLINDGVVRMLRMALAALPTWAAAVFDQALTAAYYVLPSLDPFGERTGALLRNLRPVERDWWYLLATFGYALLLLAWAQALTVLLLRRRPTT
jgi:hypothetical protein